MTEEAKVEVSKEMDEFIAYVEKLSVLDLSKLVKALEQRLGVTAAVPMAAAAPAAGAAAPAAEEKTAFDVILSAVAADKKIAIIKEVRAITGLGLKEAKDLVEGAPKPVKEGATKEEAEKMKAQLVAAGATVELK